MGTDLLEISNQFLLGIYRNAVDLYQPLIEKRTGIRLGSIHVRDFRQLESDRILALRQKKIRYPWWYRLIRHSVIEEEFRESCRQLQALRGKYFNGGAACYFRKSIYVNFGHGSLYHEEGLAFLTVHELAHALWESIAGQALDQSWPEIGPLRKQFRPLIEGHATYAEQIWFRDFYPASVRELIDRRKRDVSVYDRGRQRIAELVDEFGSEVLFVIPKRWQSFCE